MNRVKKFFLNLWYGLPFGLKAADTEIMGSKEDLGEGVHVNEQISDGRVAKHLLKGEITQEVEELRYRTYKVDREAKNYSYLGNGVAIKKDEDIKETNKTYFRFTQENDNICETVLESLNQVGNYGVEKYRLEIDYKDFVRFKIEKFATKIDVDINEQVGKIETTLHFNTEPNPYDATSMPFINELKKLFNVRDNYSISRNEILSSILNISFSTYKANGEDDLVNYSFINGAKFKDFRQEGYEYLITFTWDEYIRMPLNLESKYYSKSMAEKYEKKEAKDSAQGVAPTERKRYCSVCGKEMSVYDADIQEADGHEPICKECMEKVFKNQK